MPVTLAQAKLNTQDYLMMGVIDEFAKSNFLLSNMQFDQCVSPTGGGGTMTFGYNRLITQPKADFRGINTEYTPQETTSERITGELKIFGGSFEIDRVIAKFGGVKDQVALQLEQKIKATKAVFNDGVINGDSGTDANSFDGLDKALTGSSTEYKDSIIDLSSSAKIDENYKVFLDILDEFLSSLDGTPTALMGNAKMMAKLRAVARRATMYSTSKDNWGNQVEMYGNIALVDLGTKAGNNNPVVEIYNETIDSAEKTGLTSLYAARLGMDGLHGLALTGDNLITTMLPDYKTAGAIKKGEVEMVVAIALKATKSAGVLRRIKVK